MVDVEQLDEFQLACWSIPKATFDYLLAGLEWVDAAENVVLVCPPGTGKSHVLTGSASLWSTTASECAVSPPPTSERLYAGLTDNTVGKTIARSWSTSSGSHR